MKSDSWKTLALVQINEYADILNPVFFFGEEDTASRLRNDEHRSSSNICDFILWIKSVMTGKMSTIFKHGGCTPLPGCYSHCNNLSADPWSIDWDSWEP